MTHPLMPMPYDSKKEQSVEYKVHAVFGFTFFALMFVPVLGGLYFALSFPVYALLQYRIRLSIKAEEKAKRADHTVDLDPATTGLDYVTHIKELIAHLFVVFLGSLPLAFLFYFVSFWTFIAVLLPGVAAIFWMSSEIRLQIREQGETKLAERNLEQDKTTTSGNEV